MDQAVEEFYKIKDGQIGELSAMLEDYLLRTYK
jgi:hypothetical protein